MPIRLADSALQSLKKGLTILQKFRLLTFFRKTRTRQTQPNMKRIIDSLFAVAASVALVSSASALTWIEVGDAGQSIATSQTPIPAGQPLNSIFGSFLSTSDVDIFTIFISNPALFSATTVLGTSTLIDTSLFLFNSSGLPVYMNDDARGGGHDSVDAARGECPWAANGWYLLSCHQSFGQRTGQFPQSASLCVGGFDICARTKSDCHGPALQLGFEWRGGWFHDWCLPNQ